MSRLTISVEKAQWPAPPNVSAITTLRIGGVSENEFTSLNLAQHVGDDPLAVEENRSRLMDQLMLPSTPIWLDQEHGNRVIQADLSRQDRLADGSYTRERGVVCAVLTADCIPLFLTDYRGSIVSLLHIGWRGLITGVIESGLEAIGISPEDILAWIGPRISRKAFVIGDDVRQQLMLHSSTDVSPFERYGNKWLADLGVMVEQRLRAFGLVKIYLSTSFTSDDQLAWYSYRRDGECGRMASLIWLR